MITSEKCMNCSKDILILYSTHSNEAYFHHNGFNYVSVTRAIMNCEKDRKKNV